ncbi:hypothetical protein PEC18_00235 [Paucibacter sp. O1-1]|nr:hypothetical protein [Paucibacter sp. O1-1]MDA3824348.1 hypothetical protein [Paucibacter sp. O1-1]
MPNSVATHHCGNSASSRRSSASSYSGRPLASTLRCQCSSAAMASRISGSARSLGPVPPSVCTARRYSSLPRSVSSRKPWAASAASTCGPCRPARWMRPAMSTKGRTSSCGGGASITMQLRPLAPCTRR